VLGNAHKWAFWENDRQRADDAVDWLEEKGLDIRGHTCVYGVDYAVPDDVMQAVENGDGATVRERSMQHLHDIITHYGDRIQEWDVVNEAVHRGLLQGAVYPDRMDTDNFDDGEVQPWTSPLLAEWFGEAESVIDENGLDVDVVTNDYNTLTWDVEKYAEAGPVPPRPGRRRGRHRTPGPHRGGRPQRPALDLRADRPGVRAVRRLPAPQRITEFDMYGDTWSDQQQRADIFRRFLETAYGHPTSTSS